MAKVQFHLTEDEQKTFKAPCTPKRLHTFGAYNWRSSSVTYTTARPKNSDTFIDFLEAIVAEYPRQQLILVPSITTVGSQPLRRSYTGVPVAEVLLVSQSD